MARDPRVSKAFNAMKDLGIRSEIVKPVLKKLLKLYDKNWELIEDDNYSTLADAIFEYTEDEQGEDQNEDTPEDELEPLNKKQRLKLQEDQVSSTKYNSSIDLNQEDSEIPQLSAVAELEPSPLSLTDREMKPGSHLHQARLHDKENDMISSHSVPRDVEFYSERATSTLHSNVAVDDTGFINMQTDVMPKNEPNEGLVMMMQPTKESQQFAAPTSIAHPGLLEGSSSGNSLKHLITHVDNDNKDDGSASNFGSNCKRSVVLASSSSGEVTISLNFNFAPEASSFRPPNVDSALKFVEEKYKRMHNIVQPQFSVQKLVKDLCQSYLDIANGSVYIPIERFGADCLPGISREVSRSTNNGRPLKMNKSNCIGSPLNLVVSERLSTADDKKKAFRKVRDITKGTEKVRISLLDEVGNGRLPDFVYVSQNIIYQNAYVHASLARIVDDDCCPSCIGNCLSSSIPCACARDTGGEFAYTPQGLLREDFLKSCISMNQEPEKHYHFYCEDCPLERAKNAYAPQQCKGHLVRKFIKECWSKCGCNLQCGNRVVQRGLTCNLQVFMTNNGKGWGVRTLESLPEGAFVCEYVGEILTNMELYERNAQRTGIGRHTYPVLLDADWASEKELKDEDALCLDGTNYGNVSRFINHRCFDANLIDIPVEVETPDHHYYHLAFFTKRKVAALEELTWDYRIDFDDHNHPIKAFHCHCGSAFCRDASKGAKAGPLPARKLATG